MNRVILNEFICRKCWIATHDGAEEWWTSDDTESFNLGTQFCPKDVAGKEDRNIVTTNPPPKWCPHKLEHAMAVSAEK